MADIVIGMEETLKQSSRQKSDTEHFLKAEYYDIHIDRCDKWKMACCVY